MKTHTGSDGFGIILAAMILAVVSAAGLSGWYVWRRGASSDTKVSCMPPKVTSLTEGIAETAYGTFVRGVKSNRQTCVNSLTTKLFQDVAKVTYGAPDGNWLHKKAKTKTGFDYLRDLPANLDATKFKNTDYVRPDYSAYNLDDASHPKGTTIKYPVESDAGYTVNVNVSFIVVNTSVLVDNLKIVPAQVDSE